MAAMGDWLENRLVDFIFRGVAAPTLPANLFIALFKTNPSDTGAAGTEVSTAGTNYARASVPRAAGVTGWAATDAAGSQAATSGGTSGTTSNNSTITFNAPGGTAWATGAEQITHVGVFDASTGGNMLFFGALTTAKTVNANDAAPSFAAGQMVWQIDN